MGPSRVFSLEASDIGGFIGACVLGYIAGVAATSSPWAIVIQIVVTYHLFLFLLVLRSNQAVRLSMSLPATVVTHLACLLVALIPLAIGYHATAAFEVLRYAAAGVAVFERGWLFGPVGSVQPERTSFRPGTTMMAASDGDDFEEWQRHLASLGRGGYRAGISIRDEYETWLRQRRNRAQAA